MLLLFAILLLIPALGAAGVLPKLPVVFEPNAGQWNMEVKYAARGSGWAMWLTKSGAVLRLKAGRGEARWASVEMRLSGASPDVVIEALRPLEGRSSYFAGDDPAKWISSVPQFGMVKYRGVWEGIDLLFYVRDGRPEYDFVVAPGADPAAIRLEFTGTAPAIGRDGDLLLRVPGGEIRHRKPSVYQEAGARREAVHGRYRRRGKREIGFRLARYDRSRPVVIDPALAYSTYFGGSSWDYVNGMAVDPEGSVYIVGTTTSADLPHAKPLQPELGTSGAGFVAKLNRAGSAYVYCTYLVAIASGIAVDAAGNAYVTGNAGPGFARKNQIPGLGGALFVAKLDPTGAGLVYSTLLGGQYQDAATAIAVDAAGNAYITGSTNSDDFPVKNAFQPKQIPGFEAFVTKLNAAGSAIVYSTYLGGGDRDGGLAIAVDSAGNAIVAGRTVSPNFPRKNVDLGSCSSVYLDGSPVWNAFVTKLDASGSALVFSGCFGSILEDEAKSVAVDPNGNVVVAGATASSSFPVVNAMQSYGGGNGDAFVTKFTPAGAVVYSTFLGGAMWDGANGVATDALGNAYVTGWTSSDRFPVTAGAVQSKLAAELDAFVAKLDPKGTRVLYGTYLGGAERDYGKRLAVDAFGSIYVAGETSSADFPVRGAAQARYGGPPRVQYGVGDVFIAKIDFSDLSLAARPASLTFEWTAGAPAPPPQEVELSTAGSLPFTVATFGGDWLSANPDRTTAPARLTVAVNPARLAAGVHNGSITITCPNAVNSPQVIPVRLVVSAGPYVAASGVVNAASYAGGAVAPGEIVTIFGARIGPPSLVTLRLNPAGRVDTSLGGTRVLFDNVPAPLIYVSASQASAVVPYAVAGKSSTRITVEYGGETSAGVTVPVAAAAPGILTLDASGKGQAAALNQDSSVNTSDNPAEAGSVAVLFVTGEGETDPPGLDGRLATEVFPKPKLPVSVQIGGAPAEILYAGAAPGFVAGVMQVNVRVPSTAPAGDVAVTLTVGTASSQPGATVALKRPAGK